MIRDSSGRKLRLAIGYLPELVRVSDGSPAPLADLDLRGERLALEDEPDIEKTRSAPECGQWK